MRATVSIYEDPEFKSNADVWESEESKKKFYAVLAVSLAAASSMGYVAYQLLWTANGTNDTNVIVPPPDPNSPATPQSLTTPDSTGNERCLSDCGTAVAALLEGAGA
ncbi:hypothetical protein B0H19DRAFT_1365296 [Mycena capillaripes]|nr:hypothetical protein B0H19DRAFT_1365296 [Mycena capillaripes]